jgi:hypothetical protein
MEHPRRASQPKRSGSRAGPQELVAQLLLSLIADCTSTYYRSFLFFGLCLLFTFIITYRMALCGVKTKNNIEVIIDYRHHNSVQTNKLQVSKRMSFYTTYSYLGVFFLLFGANQSFIIRIFSDKTPSVQNQKHAQRVNTIQTGGSNKSMKLRRHAYSWATVTSYALFSDLMLLDTCGETLVAGGDLEEVDFTTKQNNHQHLNRRGFKRKVHLTKDMKTTSIYTKKKGTPWKADFVVSSKTQRRIQNAAKRPSQGSIFESVNNILEELLTTSPEECNEVNAMCALTLCTKKIAEGTCEKTSIPSTLQVQTLKGKLKTLLDIIIQLIESKQLNFRQLANAAWCASKLLQLLRNIRGVFDECHYRHSPPNYTPDDDLLLVNLEKVLQNTIQPIIEHLSTKRATLRVTTGEISMILWAYSQWRAKVEPTGWMWPPTDARLPLQNRQFNDSSINNGNVILFEQLHRSWGDRRVTDVATSNLSDSADSVQLVMSQAANVLLSIVDAPDEARQQKLTSSIDMRANVSKTSYKWKRMVANSTWNELANIAHSFARSQFGSSAEGDALMKEICEETIYRLTTNQYPPPLSWDISLIVWSLGVMQVGKYQLATSLRRILDAMIDVKFIDVKDHHNLPHWNTKDIVQLSIALAHAAIDDQRYLKTIFHKATITVDSFQSWELTVLLWVQARLYLTSKLEENDRHDVYTRFTSSAVSCLHRRMIEGKLDGLGSQGKANLAWSLTVLEEYSADSIDLLRAIFAGASGEHSYITHEHAHQFWQAYFILKSECPQAVDSVPKKFALWLEERWKEEKSRKKLSSSSHKSLSDTLRLMRVAHVNEHDEDIDVAIILEENSAWTSQASLHIMEPNGKRLQHRIGK